MLSQETTCKGLQTIFVKTIQSAFKEIELFRYFSCMVSKSFNDLNHFFLIYLTKMLLQKRAPVGINTSRRTITKPR